MTVFLLILALAYFGGSYFAYNALRRKYAGIIGVPGSYFILMTVFILIGLIRRIFLGGSGGESAIEMVLTILVMLAGLLEESTGRISFAWSLVFFVLAGTFIALALWHKYILPRPASDAQRTNITPHTILVEFGNTFVSFFNKKGIVPALLFMLTYRLGESQLVKLASPFLLDGREVGGLALSTGEVGFAYGTVGVISLLLGGVLGGLAISRSGLKTWLWPMALAISLPNLVYLYMAYTMPESIVVVNACVAVEQFGYGFGFTAYTMYLMLFAEGEYKTSHYAISTGFMALGMMLPGMASGWIQEQIGYQHFFIWVMICCIPLFIVLPFLRFKKK